MNSHPNQNLNTNEVHHQKIKTETQTKHSKESEHWSNKPTTFNRYTALLEEESEGQEHKASPENKTLGHPQ
jgi:hypothetical protein